MAGTSPFLPSRRMAAPSVPTTSSGEQGLRRGFLRRAHPPVVFGATSPPRPRGSPRPAADRSGRERRAGWTALPGSGPCGVRAGGGVPAKRSAGVLAEAGAGRSRASREGSPPSDGGPERSPGRRIAGAPERMGDRAGNRACSRDRKVRRHRRRARREGHGLLRAVSTAAAAARVSPAPGAASAASAAAGPNGRSASMKPAASGSAPPGSASASDDAGERVRHAAVDLAERLGSV